MRLNGPPPPRRDANQGGFLDQEFEITPGVRLSFLSITGITAFILALFIAIGGIKSVEITEYGLASNMVTRKVEKEPYLSGRYWIGPWCYFIKFPSVVKTIQFSDSRLQDDLGIDEQGDPMLRSRTADGLDVTIELSFQYQLHMEKVYDLYTTMRAGRDFHDLFVRVAIDRLTEIATEYTANEFFVDRTRIGKAMEKLLKEDFESRLYATIFSFQLRSVGLPDEFEKAIQMTEVKKQDVHVAEAEQTSNKVALETELMKAQRRTKVKANNAEGYAESVMLANTADIEQYKATQEKAAESYKGILKELDDKEGELLAYVQSRVLRDHISDKVTLGLTLPSIDMAPAK
jgi:regulator of protease activity HflC (stomatin/prohibitin superfamily)